MTQNTAYPITRYLPLLVEGDLNQLLNLFDGEPSLNDPRLGHIEGAREFERFVEVTRDWLRQRKARVEHLVTTQTDVRAVEECILHLVQDDVLVPLPVAIVGDIVSGALTSIRIYHSLWPILNAHLVRPPLLADCPRLAMPDVIGNYLDALSKGDLEVILQQFEPNGLAREPSGGKYLYQSLEGLRRFYGMLFANGGGISLEHCSITDNGVCCAVEYNVTRWGCTKLPPQAGVAVYERGPSSLLVAARIYDDVDPPITNE